MVNQQKSLRSPILDCYTLLSLDMLPWRRNNFNFPTTRLVSAQTERKTELSFSRQKPLSSVWDTHYEQQNMLQTLNIIKCKQPKFFDSYIEFLVCVCIGFKTFSSVVRHLDSVASYLPTGLHLGFFCSWPSLFLPSSFSSVIPVLSFVSASTSMLFWAVFLLPFKVIR